MRNYYGADHLELVELYAKEKGYISSEDELSILFDRMIDDNYMPMEKITLFANDPCLLYTYANFKEDTYSSGDIHELQYQSYNYVGVYNCRCYNF